MAYSDHAHIIHHSSSAQLLAIVLLTGQADAHLKLALVKAKLAAIKAPHVAAHVAVATDVKFKTVDAFWKSVAAIKATKLAAASIITAPVRVVGKTIALKLAALKAAKALKVATALRVVDSLKRNPIIVPVPVPVKVPFPVLPHHDAIAALGGGPINGLISGAQSILQATGTMLCMLTYVQTYTNRKSTHFRTKTALPADAQQWRCPAQCDRFRYGQRASRRSAGAAEDVPVSDQCGARGIVRRTPNLRPAQPVNAEAFAWCKLFKSFKLYLFIYTLRKESHLSLWLGFFVDHVRPERKAYVSFRVYALKIAKCS